MAKQWNFGMPAKGSVRVERHKVSVKHAGQTWNAHWELDGDKLIVCSAYGSRSAPSGPDTDRPALAEALLAEIVIGRG
jgi:hypothetical protein